MTLFEKVEIKIAEGRANNKLPGEVAAEIMEILDEEFSVKKTEEVVAPSASTESGDASI